MIDGDAVVPVFITSVAPEEYAIAPAGGVVHPGPSLYTLAAELLAIMAGDGALVAGIIMGEPADAAGIAYRTVHGLSWTIVGEAMILAAGVVLLTVGASPWLGLSPLMSTQALGAQIRVIGPLLTRRGLIVTGEARTIPMPLAERS